ADMHVGISRIALERGDLPGAREHLRRATDLGDGLGLPQNPYRRRVAMAQVLAAEGDPAGALDLLAEAERVYTGDFSPNVRPVPAQRARLLAGAGQVAEAVAWLRASGLSADDDLSYVREYEHVTVARILLTQHGAGDDGRALDRATSLLDRLLVATEQGGRTGTGIEVLVLQALAHHAG